MPRDEHRTAARDGAETIHGLRACLAVFARRRDDVLRVAFTRAVRHEALDLARWAAARRLPCAEVTDAELDRIAGSSHHEGLCVAARPRRWLPTGEIADRLLGDRGTALALDRVRNPYNVGAMMRTAAFFGVRAALLGAPAPHPGLAPTAVRVAEGGVEYLDVARTTDLAETLSRLRARGVRVVGADPAGPTASSELSLQGPVVLVVGNEREGLGERVEAQCDALVSVHGCGAVESLNVAVATGILLAQIAGRRGPARAPAHSSGSAARSEKR